LRQHIDPTARVFLSEADSSSRKENVSNKESFGSVQSEPIRLFSATQPAIDNVLVMF
jgi:hypothetical protein